MDRLTARGVTQLEMSLSLRCVPEQEHVQRKGGVGKWVERAFWMASET